LTNLDIKEGYVIIGSIKCHRKVFILGIDNIRFIIRDLCVEKEPKVARSGETRLETIAFIHQGGVG
jgi:hypothetical protein